ncbi:hypothetical protein BDP55DRAFT_384630 [Colletotrichum godetiae]|uniref:Uncharacterized protein n=1 Tax=Colletotrichum godetiae TaxID=1209918 RepID=A0AAJ0F1X2_9PEZI|nr:uncharacterized protein BDP55DRAFT_384630 [Colletotrichum godetiae]KAK1689953.1 hypothetical protein BDP55DRAFT_384630 [Colletotrichum godetiae]
MISLAPSYLTSHNCVLCTKCASGGLYCTHFEHKYPYTFCHRGRSCNGQDRLHNSSLSQTQAGRAKGDPETPEFCCNKIHAPFIHRAAQATCSGLSALYTPLPVSTLDSKNNPLGSPCDSQLDEHRSTGILSVSWLRIELEYQSLMSTLHDIHPVSRPTTRPVKSPLVPRCKHRLDSIFSTLLSVGAGFSSSIHSFPFLSFPQARLQVWSFHHFYSCPHHTCFPHLFPKLELAKRRQTDLETVLSDPQLTRKLPTVERPSEVPTLINARF